MYGTVAHVFVKPGAEARFQQVASEFGMGRVPGEVAAYAYQMDRNSREFFIVAVFESKAAYVANANSPEQHARYMQLMEVLESEPEWNDGEIVYATG
jgi:heme-degrading monooxygenase HmoA